MKTSVKAVALWVLSAVLAAEVVFLALHASLDFPFLAPALLGAVVVQIRTCRSRFELLGAVLLAVLLALVRFRLHLRILYEHPGKWGIFLGLASLFFLGVAVLRSRPQEVAGQVRAFSVALAIPGFVLVATAALSGTGHVHPMTLDRVLYAFDGSLGFQLSFVLGRLFGRLPWLGVPAGLAYEQVPVAALILYTAATGRGDRRRPDLLLALGAGSLLGYLLYSLVPAAGPIDLFPSCFPNSAPPLAGLAVVPASIPTGIPRNAMPSLHMFWAVLLWWNARRSGIWLRAGYLGYLILTILATLGSGEHYLIDLVVALPFALAIQAAFSVRPRDVLRSLPFWAGSITTLAWLGFLRFATPLWLGSRVLDWILVAVTVAGSLMLERQTHRETLTPADKRRIAGQGQLEGASARV
ncbi:MAG: phosphatase PAP2 family protein [Terriglobia bacterium]|jgi:hypothetical protein